MIDLEECKVCGFASMNYEHTFLSWNGIRLVRCPACRFVSIWQSTHRESADSDLQWQIDRIPASRAIWKKEVARISKYIAPPATMLDIGCGVGGFLSVAQESGYRVAGVDINQFAIDRVRSRELFPIHKSLEEVRASHPPFDVITTMHTLEHLSDPRKMVREANNLLKRDGVFVVTVPGYNGLTLLLDRFGKYSGWELVRPFHRNYFTFSTISHLLESEGFQVHHRMGYFGAVIQRKLPEKMKFIALPLTELNLLLISALHRIGVDINLTVYATKR